MISKVSNNILLFIFIQEDPRKLRTGSIRSSQDVPGIGKMERSSSNEDLLKNLGPLPVSVSLSDILCKHDIGLEARKPVFGGLQTTKAQTSLRIRAD